MAKTKTPFLSFGAHGSVGKSITAQKRSAFTMLREKPLPTDPYSLPQAYQRWLYEDYAYLWTQQSEATKRQYAAIGSRRHLTGFQYWMRYHLIKLPHIEGMWHLDEKTGAIAYDSSRNDNHGTIFGVSPIIGLIDGAASPDGLNDRIQIPTNPTLQNYSAKSVSFFFKAPAFTGTRRILYYHGYDAAPHGDRIFLTNLANILQVWLANTAVDILSQTFFFTPDTWHHFAYTWDGTNFRAYRDGIQQGATQPFGGVLSCSGVDLTLASQGLLFYSNALLDHVLDYRRGLDATEVLRHSLRRYQL